MNKGFFITGTDTGIGKTVFTVSLMEELKARGKTVSGMKPIASGASFNNGVLMNDDAKLIMQHCSEVTSYELINPFVYELPVAPHIAAKQKKERIDLDIITTNFKALSTQSEIVIVEGVGGWRLPLTDELSLSNLVSALGLPVILVVGLKLGCINHAILTAQAIQADGIELYGWVSNHLSDKYLFANETINTLSGALACPHIAELPYLEDFLAETSKEGVNFLSNLAL